MYIIIFILSQRQTFFLSLFLTFSLLSLSLFHPIQEITKFMSEKGGPLPKFGEWDVNDPASADGFTVIFNKARDEKKTGGKTESPLKSDPNRHRVDSAKPPPKKWFCCAQAPKAEN